MSTTRFEQCITEQHDNGAYGACPFCNGYNNSCTAINDTYDVTWDKDTITGELTEVESNYVSTTYDYPTCIHCNKDLTPKHCMECDCVIPDDGYSNVCESCAVDFDFDEAFMID